MKKSVRKAIEKVVEKRTVDPTLTDLLGLYTEAMSAVCYAQRQLDDIGRMYKFGKTADIDESYDARVKRLMSKLDEAFEAQSRLIDYVKSKK